MEIIRPDINKGYEILNIPADEIVLEYLKKQEYRFKVVNIDEKTRSRILSYDKLKEFPGKINDRIAGYVPDYKESSFRSSGGLKLSSKDSTGTFIIEEYRIIYDPTVRFFEERDAYRYDASPLSTYYTTASMKDLLLDELSITRDYFVFVGYNNIRNSLIYEEELQEVSCCELLEYADGQEKGEKLYKKILSRKR